VVLDRVLQFELCLRQFSREEEEKEKAKEEEGCSKGAELPTEGSALEYVL
jgi:hypothetical protein